MWICSSKIQRNFLLFPEKPLLPKKDVDNVLHQLIENFWVSFWVSWMDGSSKQMEWKRKRKENGRKMMSRSGEMQQAQKIHKIKFLLNVAEWKDKV